MKRNNNLWAPLLLMFVLGGVALAAQTTYREYTDPDFGYLFQFPSGWEIQELPEGTQGKDIRVVIQSPDRSSFMVVVEKHRGIMTREQFDAETDPNKLVQKLIEETVEQVYRRISKDIRAVEMKVGDRMNLSNEVGIKFYISTLHGMEKGKPIIVAGVHFMPFGKSHMINFIMTALWDREAQSDVETLKFVFNSFRLLGERPRANRESSP
jgi:hypothetical protein